MKHKPAEPGQIFINQNAPEIDPLDRNNWAPEPEIPQGQVLLLDRDSMRGETILWRHQNDGLNELASLATGIEFDWDNNLTEQQHKDSTDIEFLVRNHMIRADRAPQYIEFDYSMDLQQAIEMGNTLRDANITAPEELRSKYPDKYAILQGIDSGEYARDLQTLEKEKRLEKQMEDLRKQAAAGAPIPPLTNAGAQTNPAT